MEDIGSVLFELEPFGSRSFFSRDVVERHLKLCGIDTEHMEWKDMKEFIDCKFPEHEVADVIVAITGNYPIIKKGIMMLS